MDNILVTGGAGFLGMSLVKTLVGFGARPRVLDINTPGDPDLESNIEFIQGDIRNPDTVERVVRGTDIVFHLAAAVLPTRGKAGVHFHQHRRHEKPPSGVPGP